jgi:4-aminobutyrate aminotransferase-like enzyme
VIDDEKLAERADRLGERMLVSLRERAAGHASVAEVRGRGLMLAIEFADGARLTPRPDLAQALLAAAMARNLLLLSCGTHGQAVRIIPPLVTTDDEADLALAAIGDSLAAIGA